MSQEISRFFGIKNHNMSSIELVSYRLQLSKASGVARTRICGKNLKTTAKNLENLKITAKNLENLKITAKNLENLKTTAKTKKI
jgi:hypothetical protein